jgi:hypothetical protein
MTASIDTLDTVRALSQEGYKYGFVTDIEVDEAPKRPSVSFRPKRTSLNGCLNGGWQPSAPGKR